MDPQRIGTAQQQLFERGKSSREKYSDLVVGQPGLLALLKTNAYCPALRVPFGFRR